MENNVLYNQEEETIDLMGLLFCLLKQWKVLIIAALIGLVLGTGISFHQNNLPTVTTYNLDDLQTEQIEQYDGYQKLYESQLKYETNSLVMQMDSNAVYMGEVNYFFSADVESVDLICAMYQELLSQEGVQKELLDASGLDATEQDIREMVNISAYKVETTNGQVLFQKLPQGAKIYGSVNAPTRESCAALLDMIKRKIDEKDQELKAEQTNYTSQLLSTQISFGTNSSVNTRKKDAAETKKKYLTEILALEKTLTRDDLDYYEHLVKKQKPATLSQWLKWPLVLGFLFGLLAVAFFGVRYVTDSHVKTEDELRERYGLFLLASLEESKGKPRKGIDGWLDRLSTRRQLPANSREYLKDAVQALDFHKAALCAAANETDTANLASWLVEQDARLFLGAPLFEDGQTQLAAKDGDGVILIVRLWKTTRQEILRQMEICQTLHRSVLGVVVVR